LMAFFIT